MPDNSFEKKVRDKLNEFGLSPTTRVWEGVEARLHEKRKRERGILWLVFAMLLLGGGGFLLYSGNNTGSKQTLSALEQKKEPVADVTLPSEKTNAQNVLTEKNISASETTSEKQNQNSGSTAAANSGRPVLQVGAIEKAQHDKAVTTKKTNDDNDSGKTGTAGKHVNNRGNPVSPQVAERDLISKTDEKDQIDQGKPEVEEKQTATEEKTAPAVVNEQKQTEALPPKESEKNAAQKKLAKENKKSWQFGISANIGLTALPQYLLAGPQKSMRADNLNTGSLPGIPPMNYPYSQEQESGWGAGFWARRDISKKMALSVGLQYQYYSTSTKTGYQAAGQVLVNNGYQNVSLDNYYLPGSVTEYRNRYHMIQMPLQIRTTFGKKNLVPVSLSAGIQPGWLAGSNALLKDKDSSGILYSDKANFNRFQFGFNAGFQMRLLNKSRTPIDIGPVFQYQLTSAFRENTGYSGHLLFFGLQADWQLFNLGKKQRQ